MRSKTKKTAVCGFAAALSVVLMLITAVAPFFMYVLPIASGLIVLFVADFADKKWAVAVYFATAILSMLLLTDKEAALVYILFFGYYPLIRDFLKGLGRVLYRVLSFALFNACAFAIGWAGVAFFGVSAEEYSEFGKLTIPLLLFMANIAFVLYDILLSRYGGLINRFSERVEKLI